MESSSPLCQFSNLPFHSTGPNVSRPVSQRIIIKKQKQKQNTDLTQARFTRSLMMAPSSLGRQLLPQKWFLISGVKKISLDKWQTFFFLPHDFFYCKENIFLTARTKILSQEKNLVPSKKLLGQEKDCFVTYCCRTWIPVYLVIRHTDILVGTPDYHCRCCLLPAREPSYVRSPPG